MRCIVTAGPTFEPLDKVRRLTNFSTGRLGSDLANHLAAHGHETTLLIGQQATWRGERHAQHVETFTTTANLGERLQALAGADVAAVFHAAAVSDFAIGRVWCQPPQGEPTELKSAKLSSREGTLLAELVPTPKIITRLREWFPQARLVGWKYEVEGGRADALRRATEQITECRTDLCIANGAAYGDGFGLVRKDGGTEHLPTLAALLEALERFIRE